MENHKFKAQLARWPLAAKSDDWQETAFHWLVTINGAVFDFYTGLGRAEWNTRLLHQHFGITDVTRIMDVEKWKQYGKPTSPKLDDVLHALVMDASACDMAFSDWCDNYGFSSDSRKALAIYERCQENAIKLRKAGVDIAAERERLADY